MQASPRSPVAGLHALEDDATCELGAMLCLMGVQLRFRSVSGSCLDFSKDEDPCLLDAILGCVYNLSQRIQISHRSRVAGLYTLEDAETPLDR
jgi:hypothetical protein